MENTLPMMEHDKLKEYLHVVVVVYHVTICESGH